MLLINGYKWSFFWLKMGSSSHKWIGILGDNCMAIELTNYGNIKELKYNFPYYPPVIKRGWLGNSLKVEVYRREHNL